MKIGDEIDHWSCGRHSDIPECCIHFFTGPWEEICSDASRHHAYWQRLEKAAAAAGYILCPQCIVDERIVEIKECECGE